jgi:outer membrane receptor protein involved in Fe transport
MARTATLSLNDLVRRTMLCAAALAYTVARGAVTPETADLEALLNQPVYAASKFAQQAAEAPAAVTVLTAGDIRAYGWRTLADVLNGVRSTYVRYDRFYSYLGVRGLARPGDFSSRLLVLIDGMRVNDNIYGQAGVGREFPLDVALIERVEFVAGPGSALYGSNAVLGVVNIVTKSAASLAGGSVAFELGSDASRSVSISQGFELGAARMVVAAKGETRPGRDRYFPEYDTPETGFGLARDADRESDRKLYAKWKLGEVTAAGLVSERRKQIPTGAFGTTFPSERTTGLDRYAFADLQWQRDLDATQQFTARANLGQYDFRGSFDYGPADGLQSLDQRGRWLDLEARWQVSAWRDHRVVVGAEVQRNLVQRQRSRLDGPDGGAPAAIDVTSSRWGLFATDEIELHRDLNAVVGARLDRQLDGDRTATPRWALLWEATPGLMLKYLDGRAYREPNAYESQYEDSFALANPMLRSETLRTREVALDWRARTNLRLAASGYRYRVDDLIEQQVDVSSGLLMFNNVGAAEALGLELEADYAGDSGWRLRGTWSRQHARSRPDGSVLGNSPRSLTKVFLSLPLPLWQARGGLEWQRVGERLTVAGARLPTHAVTSLTLQLSPPGSPMSASASLYNLFDKHFADPGGPDLRQDALSQDGRQWRMQMALRF